MTLDRWIASIFLVICLVYGYTAFFSMDASLPPFMKRNPIWPSTFPKVLAGLGIVCALLVIVNAKPPPIKEDEIDYRRLGEYKIGQAAMLVALMAAYAFALRPLGFVASTVLFLTVSGIVLGERKLHILIPIALVAALFIWFLVDNVLGIFLRPWPWFV